MASPRERVLRTLLLVNVWLQIFDGVATYLGVTAGYGEGNPIVAATFTHIGMGPALFVAKLYACGCLVLIWHLRGRSTLTFPALIGTAAAYLIGSVAPWSAAFASL
jgi:uncharacterized membrane protein